MRLIVLFTILAALTLLAPLTTGSVKGLEFPQGVSAAQQKDGSISGTVVGPDSKSIRAAQVTVVLQVSADTTGSTPLGAYTDARGNFRLDSVPTGNYELHVKTAGMWMLKELVTSVAVRQSENTTVNARLQPIDQCNGSKLAQLTPADKTEIVRIMLNEALAKKGISSHVTTVTNKEVVLSTQNIESLGVPTFAGFKVLLLSPDQIQSKANHDGDLMFLQFEKIELRDSCVAVTLCNLWADGTSTIETGKKTMLGDSCIFYVFYKREGKWVGDFVDGWIE
jgi:hypothetical protein